MTSAAHPLRFTRPSLPGILTSHRAASILAAVAGAIVLLAGGFALASHLKAHTPPPQPEVPMVTSPGTGP